MLISGRQTKVWHLNIYDILWYWVSVGQCWLVLCDIGSVQGGTGRYWLVLDGAGSVESGTGCTLWYWVNIGQYRLIYDVTGSV